MKYVKVNPKISKYKIYCDLDGVLTDFDKQVKDIGVNPDNQNKFWSQIDSEGTDFWKRLPWVKGGRKLWNYIKRYRPTILSALPKSRHIAVNGKFEWVKDNLGNRYANNAIFCMKPEKKNYANSRSILIDDTPKNIKEWIENGGIGIIHTDINRTIKELDSILSKPVRNNKNKSLEKKFLDRTYNHIDRVNNNIISISDKLSSPIVDIFRRGRSHDATKLTSDEFWPYVWLTEQHRRKDNGEPELELSKEMQEKINKATEHHILNNRHHPEYNNSPDDMNELDIAEMVSDWAAMSQELNSSLKEWADKNVNKSWKWNKENTELIWNLINMFE